MSKYRILYWKHIPSGIVASGDGREVKHQLPQRFQNAIDAYAMAMGLTGTDEYIAGWRRGPWIEREGSPEEIIRQVAAELEEEFRKIEIPRKQ
jgi:hypothetical protein